MWRPVVIGAPSLQEYLSEGSGAEMRVYGTVQRFKVLESGSQVQVFQVKV